MNRRKLNISTWYSLGLAVVLLVVCLILSTGVTWARYRSEVSKNIYFKVREPIAVCLGQVERGEGMPEEGRFVRTDGGSWKLDESGILKMNFAIANGENELSYEERNQEVYIRLIGTLGIQSEADDVALKLTYPSADDPEKTEEVKAKAVRIKAGSAMYATFGDGWMFRFTDKYGEELAWTLEGGALSCMEMELSVEGGALRDTSLLQLQIFGKYIPE